MKFLKKLTTVIVVSVTCISLAACGKKDEPQKSNPALVSAVTVTKHEIPITYEYAGRVAAYRSTEVRARVGGILLRRNFIEGNEVKEGDLLFEIDPATYEADVAGQKASVAQAQANYDQAVRNAARAEELLKQQVSSVSARDQAVATRDANAAILQKAQATLKAAELSLQYTKVTAPIGGITSREQVSEGSLIAVNGLLTSITQSHPIYVNFSYTDTEAKAIQALLRDMKARGEQVDKLQVKITFGDGSVYPELGTIDFTSSTLDSTTGTLGVRAIFDNADRQLVAGQFVRVTVIGLKLNNAIIIPEASLMQDARDQYVFVLDQNNMVEKRIVKVSRQLEDRTWLLQPAVVAVVDAPTGQAGAVNASNQSEHVIGLKGGEYVINDGLFVLQQAFGMLPTGGKLPGLLTHLDGRAVSSSQPSANGQVDNSKASQAGEK